MATLGIVGLGLLGSAVAGRLRAGGHDVVGYDLVAEKAKSLVELGGRAAQSAEAVAQSVEAVCVVLPSLASVEAVVLGPRGLAASGPPGRTIIQMSTISPALTERLAREVTAKGLAFLDAPISGTSAMVARGEGIVLVGGERGVFDRWRPLLETILPSAVFIGRAGQAMLLKLVANLLVALHLGLVLDVLCRSAASSRMLEVRGPLIARAEFPPQMKLDLFMKDLHLIQEAARRVGAPLPLTDVAERLYAVAMEAGHGGADLSVVVKAFEGLRRI